MLRVAPATAPWEPRLARLRTNTPGLPSRWASILNLSPSTAPPVIGLEGSIATTATRWPASTQDSMSRPVRVLFPAPGGPVTPTMWARDSLVGTVTSQGGLFSTIVTARANGPQ